MCAAGGGDSKVYRPRFPLNPDEVVGCGLESVKFNYLLDSTADNAVVLNPVLTVPQFHVGRDALDRYEPFVCEHQFVFSDAGERGYLTFLPELAVLSVLDDRYAEHHRGGLAVDVAASLECVQHPLLTRKPSEYACFDGAEVRDDQLVPGLRYERRPYELGECARDIAVPVEEGVVVALAHELTGGVKIGHVVLREILKLADSPSEPPRSRSAVELEHAFDVLI